MSRQEVFAVTEHHLKLLQRMYVCWDDTEFGAPAINPKLPYGNSDVIGDVCEIVGCDEANADRLHREMQTVLQILCGNLSIAVGAYIKAEPYGSKWEKQ